MRRKYDIQPKKTKYGGIFFRSSLEARWAVFFDCLGIEYVYEPEWYEVETGGKVANYRPDFFLPKLVKYIEIKPDKPMELENTKAAGWSKHIGDIIILFSLKPPTDDTENGWLFLCDGHSKPVLYDGILWCECPKCGHIDLEQCGWITSCGCFTDDEINKMEENREEWGFSSLEYFSRTKRLLDAYKIANNYRFSKISKDKIKALPFQKILFK